MTSRPPAGQVVILNGAPRSGKSSIVAAVQDRLGEAWGACVNLGVDVHQHVVPATLRPGIGLRPGGERPDLEPFVVAAYAALYDSVAAHSRQGLNVVVDVGHHDAFSEPRRILPDCARRLAGLPVLFVGVRCPLDVIMKRRRQAHPGREGQYLSAASGEVVPAPVLAWQREVHRPGLSDLDVDTSVLSPEACADLIERALLAAHDGPSAFERLAGGE